MTRGIPDRWLQYKPYGTPIKGTKILAFKVPLNQNLSQRLDPEQRFMMPTLLQAFPELKCIIDLTNTCRYYKKEDLTGTGVRYEKLMIRGHEVPSMEDVYKFFKLMDDFISASGEGELVGVHCTHGVNRTGYLICRYLVQQLGWDLQNCLTAFEQARGYSIERVNYLADLRETPRGKKIDTSQSNLLTSAMPIKKVSCTSAKQPENWRKEKSQPIYSSPRRDFRKERLFPRKHFAYDDPSLGFDPIPPRPPGSSIYGPRPFKYGPPRPPSMPPPPSGFPDSGLSPHMPHSSRPTGGYRLPPRSAPRLPRPKMPQLAPPSRHPHGLNRQNVVPIKCKRINEQDFTVDTFEEN